MVVDDLQRQTDEEMNVMRAGDGEAEGAQNKSTKADLKH